MDLVLYSLNGNFFNFAGNPFGAFIQSSDGLFDELKPKSRFQYNWPDEHGLQISTKAKSVYESREIKLRGWIEGSDWLDIKTKFDELFKPFRGSLKVRLTINPFDSKTLVYDVLTTEEITFNKKFINGQMIGFFELNLIEPNPIKKILKTTKNSYTLKFDHDSKIEVNDGHGDSGFFKTLNIVDQPIPSRIIKGGYPGRNYLQMGGTVLNSVELSGRPFIITTNQLNSLFEVQLSFEMKTNSGGVLRDILVYPYADIGVSIGTSFRVKNTVFDKWEIFNLKTTIIYHGGAGLAGQISWYDFDGSNDFSIKNIAVKKGNNTTPYSPAPEDVNYISLAGKIDDLILTENNLEIEWDRL